MVYQEFTQEFLSRILEEKEFHLREEMLHYHPCGESSEDERTRNWIIQTNAKYFNTESEVLQGDFLEIDSPNPSGASNRFYMKYLYEEYQKNGWERVLWIIRENMRFCSRNEWALKNLNLDDFESIRGRLLIRPISYIEQEAELKNAICQVKGDIALTVYIFIGRNEMGFATCKVSRESLEGWGLSAEEVWNAAMENTMLDALPRMYKNPLELLNPPYTKGAFIRPEASLRKKCSGGWCR